MSHNNGSGTSGGRRVPASSRCRQDAFLRCQPRTCSFCEGQYTAAVCRKRRKFTRKYRSESGFFPSIEAVLQERVGFCNVKVCQPLNLIQPSPLILDRTTDKPIILGYNLIHAIKPRGKFMVKSGRGVVCLLCTAVVVSMISAAAAQDRIIGDLASGPKVQLNGNMHGLARPENDLGRADGKRIIEGVSLNFRLSPAQQSDLDQFLAELADRSSPNYHKY